MAGIVYVDYYIPKTVRNVPDMLEETSLSKEEMEEKKKYYKSCSIEQISMWADESPAKAICDMVHKMVKETQIDTEKITYVYVANPRWVIRDGINIPYYVKEKCGLQNATILFMSDICASSVMSIGLAAERITSHPDEYALIVSLNGMNEDERFRNFTVAGDGAAIALIGAGNEIYQVKDFHSMSYGENSLNFYDEGKAPKTGLQIAKVATRFIKEIYKKNDLQLEDVKQIIAQNTNLMQLNIFTSLLKMPKDYIYTENIEKSGHVGDVDTIRNLVDIKGKENGRYLLYASGLYETQDIIFAELILEKVR